MIRVDESIVLRLLGPSDAGRIFAALDTYRADMRIWLPFVDTTFDASDSLKYIRFVESSGEKVFAIEAGGEFCGLAGFRDTDESAGQTEIGYWLIPPFRGRGIMRRCVRVLCGCAFDTMGVKRVIIKCAVGNRKSAAVPLSLGFEMRGIEPRGELLSDGWTDLAVWELERKDVIRDVGMRDAADITRIYNHYILDSTASFETAPLTEECMSERIENIRQSFPYLVCECGGRIAGYCYAHAWKERAAYDGVVETTVYVDRDFTGHGIGERLMRALIERLRTTGCRALVACITAENTASRRLHSRLGFVQVSHFKAAGLKFGRLLDVTDYQLMLS